MNELRLKYKNETGHYPDKGNNSSLLIGPVDEDYVEWLEEQLNHPLFPKARIDLTLVNSSEDYEKYIAACAASLRQARDYSLKNLKSVIYKK